MVKIEIKSFDGKKYLPTKRVRLDGDGRVFQEYMSADIMNPDVLYVDESSGEIVKDGSTYYELRKKYAFDEGSLNGDFILSSEFDALSEENFGALIQGQPDELSGKNPSELIKGLSDALFKDLLQSFAKKELETIAKLEALYDDDIEVFSANAAKGFGHILKSHGINDAQEFFKGKLDGEKYGYCKGINNGGGQCNARTGEIAFGSVETADNFLRAHEMAHRIPREFDEHGLTRSG